MYYIPLLSIQNLQVETRIESIDVKLAKLNAELTTYQTKLSKMRDGPGKSAIKSKALKVLQQRKMYESQRDQLQQQSWNMEQAGMMQDNLKNVMTTVDAMKTTNKALKQQIVRVSQIVVLHAKLADPPAEDRLFQPLAKRIPLSLNSNVQRMRFIARQLRLISV